MDNISSRLIIPRALLASNQIERRGRSNEGADRTKVRAVF